MKKHIDAFKRLLAVMKDVNGNNRQIIKTLQDQIDYLMEFIAVQGEIIEQATGYKQPKLSEEQKRRLAHRGKKLNEFIPLMPRCALSGGCFEAEEFLHPPRFQDDPRPRLFQRGALDRIQLV